MKKQVLSIDPCFLVAENPAIKGEGIRTRMNFAPGDLISRFDHATPAEKSWLTVQISRTEHVHMHELRFLNHSCEPNVIIDVSRRVVLAIREILPGEELTFYYPSTEWDMDQPFDCRCGCSRCLGYIAGARHLPMSVLENYFINPHISELICEMLEHSSRRALVSLAV